MGLIWILHLRAIEVSVLNDRKEALFEEPLEKVWEKGGSGLVFHTDAAHWARRTAGGGEWDAEEGFGMGGAGDLDELHADDWDVDTRAYYERSGAAPTPFARAPEHCAPGERDLGDLLEMRASERLETLGDAALRDLQPSRPLAAGEQTGADELHDSSGNQPRDSPRTTDRKRKRKRVPPLKFGDFERHTRVLYTSKLGFFAVIYSV